MFGFEGTKHGLEPGFSERGFCMYPERSKASIFLDSSMVEHSAVNRVVVGSSPTRGVRQEEILGQQRTLSKYF